MTNMRNGVLLILLSIVACGCSRNLPINEVYGTYAVSYPFGTEVITLKTDRSFVQRVAIENEQAVTVQGSCEYDEHESRITLTGTMIVVDGFGRLRNDWRTVTPGVDSMDVEKHWSRILIGSAAKYPYVKQ